MNDLNLNCNDCPAFSIFTEEIANRIQYNYSLLQEQILKIEKIRLFILHSYIGYHYFYDLSDRDENWLLNSLKNELLKDSTDSEFLIYLQQNGILFVNAAFCRLTELYLLLPRKLDKLKKRAITICFKRHVIDFLKLYPHVPIITLFEPSNISMKENFNDIYKRIAGKVLFKEDLSLPGLKSLVNFLLTNKS
ncbi:MAG: hypothetical protein GX437_00940 [Sphingobacteriales bacterium]|nr:hypothetical protein [Sphingobacteriales bacterium]